MRRKFYQIAVIIVSLLVINGLSRNFLELWQQKKRVERVEQDVADLEQKEVELRGQLRYFQSDEYVEKIAREKLLLGKEGETVLLLPTIFLSQPPITDRQSLDIVPFWKRWFKKLGLISQ
jgi:cell division protein FtsB